MTIRSLSVASFLGLALAACTTADGPIPVEPDGGIGDGAGPPRVCDDTGVQGYLGQTATEDLGATLLAETGSQILRWAPPRSAMTMDYRPERVTVSYDDNMVIDRITCG